MTGLFGGAFDPPHNGHAALVQAAIDRFSLERLLVLVVVDPGHRDITLPFPERFELARLAFGTLPGTEVVPEEHAYTVDALRERPVEDGIFLVGADEFVGFLGWKDPNGVLAQVRLGVASRPGVDPAAFDAVLAALERPDRVEFFEIPAVPVSARDIRARLARGGPVDDLVPPAVADRIETAGLYA